MMWDGGADARQAPLPDGMEQEGPDLGRAFINQWEEWI